jgi:uncharacterized protein (TIRG00374 family)
LTADRLVALRQWQSRLLRTLASAALVVGIFWFIPFSEVVRSLQSLKLGYVLAAMAATIAVAYVQSLQLWLLLKSVNIPISTWEVFETNMITRFYGQFLPSELMAGAVKLYRLAGPRKQWGEVMAAQVCFRLINSLVLVVLGFGFWLIERPKGPGAVVGPLLAVTAAALVALHIFLSRDAPARLVKRLVSARLLAWFESGARARKAREVLRTTAASYQIFGNVITPITVIAFFRHLLGMASFALFAEAVGVHLTYLTIGWIRVVLQAVMMLPITVSGLGVREGSLVLLLQQYSVPPSQAVALSLVLFASGVLCNGIGGAFELVTLHRSGRWGAAETTTE